MNVAAARLPPMAHPARRAYAWFLVLSIGLISRIERGLPVKALERGRASARARRTAFQMPTCSQGHARTAKNDEQAQAGRGRATGSSRQDVGFARGLGQRRRGAGFSLPRNLMANDNRPIDLCRSKRVRSGPDPRHYRPSQIRHGDLTAQVLDRGLTAFRIGDPAGAIMIQPAHCEFRLVEASLHQQVFGIAACSARRAEGTFAVKTRPLCARQSRCGAHGRRA